MSKVYHAMVCIPGSSEKYIEVEGLTLIATEENKSSSFDIVDGLQLGVGNDNYMYYLENNLYGHNEIGRRLTAGLKDLDPVKLQLTAFEKAPETQRNKEQKQCYEKTIRSNMENYLVLEVGAEVPEDVLADVERCEWPVRWNDTQGNLVEMMAHAWMWRKDLRYYRRSFPTLRDFTHSLLHEWQVPREKVDEVTIWFSNMEHALFDAALDQAGHEELTSMLEHTWGPQMEQIYQVLEEFKDVNVE